MYLRRAVRVGNAVLVVCGNERNVGAGVDGGDVSRIYHGDVEEVRRVVVHRHLQIRVVVQTRCNAFAPEESIRQS